LKDEIRFKRGEPVKPSVHSNKSRFFKPLSPVAIGTFETHFGTKLQRFCYNTPNFFRRFEDPGEEEAMTDNTRKRL